MASTPIGTTTAVQWALTTVAVTNLTFPIARLQVLLHLGTAPPGAQDNPETVWLDTGAPLSVVPYHVYSRGLVWQCLGVKTTWSGQPSELGRTDVWLVIDQPPAVRGPLSLLAKFPHSDPPGDPVPILLGLEFLLSQQTEFHLLCPPQQGALVLP